MLKPAYTDVSLLHELSTTKRQDDAIKFIYKAFYTTAEIYVVQNGGSKADAEDIFQEVVVSFIDLVKQGKFRGECSVNTFVYTLTRHTWLNELKKRGRARLREEKYDKTQETVGIDVGSIIESREVKSQLVALVGQLGDTCKKILLAFYYDNLSMKEILQTLNYENEQVVRNKKYKCLKQLEQSIAGNAHLINNLKSAYWHE